MQNLKPALCPKCEELILVSQRDVFVTCPKCNENISGDEAGKKLETWVGDPANVTEVLAMCIALYDAYDPSIATSVLVIAEAAFPLNEEFAYLNLKYQDYSSAHIKNHLSRFANIKAKKYLPWAEEFLNASMAVRNMENADLFEKYIENKVISKRKKQYLEMLREMRAAYTKTATGSPALASLFAFYTIASAVNIGMMIWFLFARLPIAAYPLIVMGLLAVELGLFFMHSRIFGNREKISDNERLLMVIYMSSIAIAIGGVFLGIFVNL